MAASDSSRLSSRVAAVGVAWEADARRGRPRLRDSRERRGNRGCGSGSHLRSPHSPRVRQAALRSAALVVDVVSTTGACRRGVAMENSWPCRRCFFSLGRGWRDRSKRKRRPPVSYAPGHRRSSFAVSLVVLVRRGEAGRSRDLAALAVVQTRCRGRWAVGARGRHVVVVVVLVERVLDALVLRDVVHEVVVVTQIRTHLVAVNEVSASVFGNPGSRRVPRPSVQLRSSAT